jgi:hypothetical protein
VALEQSPELRRFFKPGWLPLPPSPPAHHIGTQSVLGTGCAWSAQVVVVAPGQGGEPALRAELAGFGVQRSFSVQSGPVLLLPEAARACELGELELRGRVVALRESGTGAAKAAGRCAEAGALAVLLLDDGDDGGEAGV